MLVVRKGLTVFGVAASSMSFLCSAALVCSPFHSPTVIKLPQSWMTVRRIAAIECTRRQGTQSYPSPFCAFRLFAHFPAFRPLTLPFCSRIAFNLTYLVPYSWSHCTFTGFMIIAAPYQLLQTVWMFLIIKKVAASLAGGKKKK